MKDLEGGVKELISQMEDCLRRFKELNYLASELNEKWSRLKDGLSEFDIPHFDQELASRSTEELAIALQSVGSYYSFNFNQSSVSTSGGSQTQSKGNAGKSSPSDVSEVRKQFSDLLKTLTDDEARKIRDVMKGGHTLERHEGHVTLKKHQKRIFANEDPNEPGNFGAYCSDTSTSFTNPESVLLVFLHIVNLMEKPTFKAFLPQKNRAQVRLDIKDFGGKVGSSLLGVRGMIVETEDGDTHDFVDFKNRNMDVFYRVELSSVKFVQFDQFKSIEIIFEFVKASGDVGSLWRIKTVYPSRSYPTWSSKD